MRSLLQPITHWPARIAQAISNEPKTEICVNDNKKAIDTTKRVGPK